MLHSKAPIFGILMVNRISCSDTPLTGHDVATQLGIPCAYVDRLATSLIRSRILKSSGGSRYPVPVLSLARPAEHVTIMDIIEAVGGIQHGRELTDGVMQDVDSSVNTLTEWFDDAIAKMCETLDKK
jgi:DNA-binding IscR family transcriptional regulator